MTNRFNPVRFHRVNSMFRLVNDSKDSMREAFQALQGNELSVLLSEQEKTVYFSKTHILDLKAVLEAERSLPPDQVSSTLANQSCGA
jgi:hypothetical protein